LKKQISPKNTWNVDTSYISLKINSEVDKSIQIQDTLENDTIVLLQEKDIIDDNVVINDNDDTSIEEIDGDNESQESQEDDDEIDEIDDDEIDDDDIEIEYEVVKIGKKYYYRSNEDVNGIYEVLKPSNEVGNKIGIYENNKAKFF
jgi:hypothetical protein